VSTLKNIVAVKSWPSKDHARVQATKSIHHSRVIVEVAHRPEDTSADIALMLRLSRSSPHSGDYSSAQDNLDNRSSMISAFCYTTTRDHDLRLQLCSLISLHVHNVKRPPTRAIMDWGEILCMQSQQSSTNKHGLYIKSTRADSTMTEITPIPAHAHILDKDK